MAEFAYFGTKEDWPAILRAVLNIDGLSVIPDIYYREPVAKQYSTLVPELIPSGTGFYKVYISGVYSRRGPAFHQFPSGPYQGMYFISQGVGPFIELSFPYVGTHPHLFGLKMMSQGCLFMKTEFYDPEHHAVERQSEAMREAYRQCKRAIKSTLTRMPLCQNILIGEHGRTLLEGDDATVLIKGYWYTGQGEYLLPNLPRPTGTDDFMCRLSDAAKAVMESRRNRLSSKGEE